MPPREGGEEDDVQQRDAGRVERVRGPCITTGPLQLTEDQTEDAGEDADREVLDDRGLLWSRRHWADGGSLVTLHRLGRGPRCSGRSWRDPLVETPRQALDRVTQIGDRLFQSPYSIEQLDKANEPDEEHDPDEKHRRLQGEGGKL